MKSPDTPNRSLSAKDESFDARTYLFPLDETEEFLDPFSDLSLFLAKRIKSEILKEENPKRWSHKIQDVLLKEILPDFSRKFPKYRLGNAALKKTWEKVNYYLHSIQQENGALQENGQIDVDFLIKRNLSPLADGHLQTSPHPYNSAHSLAIKISECIATHDGVRPVIEDLTKTIWAVQKHLINKTACENSSPGEKFDQLDRLIVRFQLETIASDPLVTMENLQKIVLKRIQNLKQLEKIRNIEDLTATLSAVLAQKLYPSLRIHKSLSKENLHSIERFVQQQIAQTKEQTQHFCQKERLQLTSRILFLYKLATHIPSNEIEACLEAAVSYVYSLSTDTFVPQGPVLRQEVYQFIDQEISLQKQRRSPDPLNSVLGTLVEIFNQIKDLPRIPEERLGEIEVVIWKVMHDQEGLIDRIPNYLVDVLGNELANIHVDHPRDSFQQIIHTSIHCLRKVREVNTNQLETKVHTWALQNDMIAHYLHFDAKDPFLRAIKRAWEANDLKEHLVDHDRFIETVLSSLLKTYPTLSGWTFELKRRITIMYKYFWYNNLSQDTESSFDRFLKWHYNDINHQHTQHFPEMTLTKLKDRARELIPLTPFNENYAQNLLETFERHQAS